MQTTVNTAARRRKVLRSVVKYWPFYIMALPGIVYLIINNYLPLAGLQVAFKRFNYGTVSYTHLTLPTIRLV